MIREILFIIWEKQILTQYPRDDNVSCSIIICHLTLAETNRHIHDICNKARGGPKRGQCLTLDSSRRRQLKFLFRHRLFGHIKLALCMLSALPASSLIIASDKQIRGGRMCIASFPWNVQNPLQGFEDNCDLYDDVAIRSNNMS